MSTTVSYAEFEHLQDRVDTLENLLSDLATFGENKEVLTKKDLKQALTDAGVIE